MDRRSLDLVERDDGEALALSVISGSSDTFVLSTFSSLVAVDTFGGAFLLATSEWWETSSIKGANVGISAAIGVGEPTISETSRSLLLRLRLSLDELGREDVRSLEDDDSFRGLFEDETVDGDLSLLELLVRDECSLVRDVRLFDEDVSSLLLVGGVDDRLLRVDDRSLLELRRLLTLLLLLLAVVGVRGFDSTSEDADGVGLLMVPLNALLVLGVDDVDNAFDVSNA